MFGFKWWKLQNINGAVGTNATGRIISDPLQTKQINQNRERTGKMGIIIMLMVAVMVCLAVGCTIQAGELEGEDETTEPDQQISAEEMWRMELYIATMEGAFREENGGDVKLEWQCPKRPVCRT